MYHDMLYRKWEPDHIMDFKLDLAIIYKKYFDQRFL